MPDGPLLVLGAGISGLTAAHRLEREGREVLVLEGRNRVGGLIHSEQVDGYLLEWGAHSVLGSADPVFDLLDELNRGEATIKAEPHARYRYICRRGKLRCLPSGPGSFLTTRALSWRGKARLLMEPLVRRRDVSEESVRDFFTRRFGEEFADYLVGPFVSGVFAGLASELEICSAFPKIHELEQKSGSVLRGGLGLMRSTGRRPRGTYTLSGGMQMLTEALAGTLEGSIQLGAEVVSLERHDDCWRVAYRQGDSTCAVTTAGVICTLPAHRSAQLLRPSSERIADLLEGIPYAGISLLQLGVKSEELSRELDGFGFLVPRKESLPILGSIWASCIFPHRAPQGRDLITVLMGGRSRPEMLEMPEEALRLRALDSLFKVLGGGFTPDLIRFRRIVNAIPQYTLGHRARVSQLREELAEMPGLVLAGSFLDGVSIPACIETAGRAASALLEVART